MLRNWYPDVVSLYEASLDYSYLVRGITCTRRHLYYASLVPHLPCITPSLYNASLVKKRPSYDESLLWCTPSMIRPLYDVSIGWCVPRMSLRQCIPSETDDLFFLFCSQRSWYSGACPPVSFQSFYIVLYRYLPPEKRVFNLNKQFFLSRKMGIIFQKTARDAMS
jgi:hypothetical protein